ncbi:MaoC/PaaZ C-terminal domain-containing protein [Nocardioides sp. SYSU DS0651]|uniref:MaoC/PaaZ C-terminal domain-containing protein n=1 Tax=Nocardioides sp. SYSU DS0651 TaxID=3415955 RepID=UPI003F4B3A4A
MTTLHAEDLAVGDVHDLGTTSATEAEIIAFAERFDPLPIHVDREAAATGPFGGIIGSAAHTLALYSSLASRVFMPRLALVAGKGIERMRLPHPLRPDVMHTASIEVLEVVPRYRDGATATDRADLRCRGGLTDAEGRVVLALEALQVIRYRFPRTR